MKKRFDVDIPLLKEQFPHVATKLELFWGEPEFNGYVNSLFVQERDKPREGFPQSIMKEILLVSNLHDLHFPNYVKQQDDRYF